MHCRFALTFAANLFLAGCTTTNPDYLPLGGDLAGADLTGVRTDLGTSTQCLQSSNCPTQICLPSGQCAPQGYAVYVDNRDGTCMGTHAGTQADPVCSLAEGLDLAAGNAHHTIFIAGSTVAYESFAVDGQTLDLYGPGGFAQTPARISPGTHSTDPAVAAVDGATVLLDGLDLSAIQNDGIDCADSTLTLSRSNLHDSADNGIYATHCQITIDRSYVGGSGASGVDAEDDSTLSVLNSYLYGNGDTGLSVPLGNTLSVRFSTILQNTSVAVDCGTLNTGPGRQIDTSLIYSNATDQNGDTITAACQLTRSAIDQASWPNGSDNHFNANPTFMQGTTPPQLLRSAGSDACCIDQLAAGTGISDVTVDFFGTSRPQGARWDIGAQEVKE